MNYPLVSVIIPVYQAEKFLRECLESVRKQDYPELEIILVNDGSMDCSREICEENARADKRIHILNQKNAGCAASRNMGTVAAAGKYLLFLDADDKMDEKNAIRSMVRQAEKRMRILWSEITTDGRKMVKGFTAEIG